MRAFSSQVESPDNSENAENKRKSGALNDSIESFSALGGRKLSPLPGHERALFLSMQLKRINVRSVELLDVSSAFAMETIKCTTALPLDYAS